VKQGRLVPLRRRALPAPVSVAERWLQRGLFVAGSCLMASPGAGPVLMLWRPRGRTWLGCADGESAARPRVTWPISVALAPPGFESQKMTL
jgi:hypothetical protein